MRSRSPPMPAPSCRGCSAECLSRPAGWPAGLLLVSSGRWPLGTDRSQPELRCPTRSRGLSPRHAAHLQRRYPLSIMDACRHHHHLLLLPQQPKRVRCQACHLTISVDELRHGYCPECFEVRGQKHYAFEDVPELNTTTRYRCEDCGVMIHEE